MLGSERIYAGVLLLFSKEEGLFEARIDIDHLKDYEVDKLLTQRIGHPLIFEKSNNSAVPSPEDVYSVWHRGTNTRVALKSRIDGSTIVVSRRDLSFSGLREKVAEAIDAAKAKLAERHHGKHRVEGMERISWGMSPEQLSSQIPTGSMNLGEVFLVLTDIPEWRFISQMKTAGPTWLVFAREKGFVGKSCRIDRRFYPEAYRELKILYGNPRSEKAATVSWWVGEDTVIVLDYDQDGETALITMANRDFFYSQIVFRYL